MDCEMSGTWSSFCFSAATKRNLCLYLEATAGASLKRWARVVSAHCSCSVVQAVVFDSLRPQDCSTPDFPVLHHLPEFAQTHVHWTDLIQPISSSVVPFSSHLQPFSASGSFPISRVFASGGQTIGASASASVLPMSIQGWFPLGWTGLIFLLFKGLSRIFSTSKASVLWPSVFSMVQLSFLPDYWKKHSFDYMGLCRVSNASAF